MRASIAGVIREGLIEQDIESRRFYLGVEAFALGAIASARFGLHKLALDALFVLTGPKGQRTVKADGYFLGLYETQLGADEILTQIRIPIPAAGSGWSYQKLKRKTGDFATAATAVLLHMKGAKVARVAIALTNAGPTALRTRAAEAALTGKPLDEASLGALMTTPALAQEPAPRRLDPPRDRPSPSGAGQPSSRVDVKDFSTATHPYRGGSDDAPAIRAAIEHAASIRLRRWPMEETTPRARLRGASDPCRSARRACHPLGRAEEAFGVG